MTPKFTSTFSQIGIKDVGSVGGKAAALGELQSSFGGTGVVVPPGFAVRADAYDRFMADVERETTQMRDEILRTPVPAEIVDAICAAYATLGRELELENPPVAVRSSATCEDSPDTSFAGQHDSFLNVVGPDALIEAVRKCYASAYNARAIAYREMNGIKSDAFQMAVAVQSMASANEGASGIAFTIDTESGFPDVIVINATWGLGDPIVQGMVEPDEYRLYTPFMDRKDCEPIISRRCGSKLLKQLSIERETIIVDTTDAEQYSFVLSNPQIVALGTACRNIARHFERPMDVEWVLDGRSKKIVIVQARPETVSQHLDKKMLHTYSLKGDPKTIVTGAAVGRGIATGAVRVLNSISESDSLLPGEVLVTSRTDPDWVPLMKRASAIVTEQGGRTSHAAIVSREFGLPAIVGAKGAMQIRTGTDVTVDCSKGTYGSVLAGVVPYEKVEIDLSTLPSTRTEVLLNSADPTTAANWWMLPVDGVGLARMEFVIENTIGIHPVALAQPERVSPEVREAIRKKIRPFEDGPSYFVSNLSEAVATIAAVHYPNQVLIRMSDFKSSEYSNLLGGETLEPDEMNPMLGFRGASRYIHPDYVYGFELECRAIKAARETIGFDNIAIMIPFCRTLLEADLVLKQMEEFGLTRGVQGLKIYVMAEIPSNIILAHEFAQRFDGFSIGSNDLTQLTLGVDRDNAMLSQSFDETDIAVTRSIEKLIHDAHEAGTPVGLCGQAPSDNPEFAAMLVRFGIDSISVTPDAVVDVIRTIAAAEKEFDD